MPPRGTDRRTTQTEPQAAGRRRSRFGRRPADDHDLTRLAAEGERLAAVGATLERALAVTAAAVDGYDLIQKRLDAEFARVRVWVVERQRRRTQ